MNLNYHKDLNDNLNYHKDFNDNLNHHKDFNDNLNHHKDFNDNLNHHKDFNDNLNHHKDFIENYRFECLIVGGNANNGSNAGLGYLNCNNSVGLVNINVGVRGDIY